MKHLKQKKGFTLVEVIVVLVIVGILLAITIPSIMGYVKKAEGAKYQAAARTVNVKVTEYVEMAILNNKTKSWEDLQQDIRANLNGQKNKLSDIVGDIKVGDYHVYSVDLEFDDFNYTISGWNFDSSQKKHTISKISVWFSTSPSNIPARDAKLVVTINNDSMYYYTEEIIGEMNGKTYLKEWPINRS